MNERVRVSLDHLREGVQIIDRQWRYVYVNEAAALHGQRPAQQLIGRSMIECYPGIDQTEMYRALQRVMQRRLPERMRNAFTYPTGDCRWFDLLINPVPDGVCVLSLDVTEQRKAEEELHHARRMDALGQLAGGVAHDFNNQLTAIGGFAELLLETNLDDSQKEDLRAIKEAADRSASLTRRLLAFSRRQLLRVEPINLNDVVRRVGVLLDRVLDADVARELNLNPALPLIMGDAQQLENVLINLAVNARDAMPAGGRLTIKTHTADLTDEDSRQHPSMVSGHYTVLTVADTGHGMDEATKAHIFEPFFTTKEPGRGTGLGLAMVYGIVKQMGGFIWVYSEPGRGTTFRLYFPVTMEARRITPVPVRRIDCGRAVTILVVENDPGVRELVVRALTGNGHRVFGAEDGEEARRQLREMATPPDVVFTDVVLPGTTGPKLVAELTLNSARVVLMSGCADRHIDDAGLGNLALLEKPFTVRELLGTLNEVLVHSV